MRIIRNLLLNVWSFFQVSWNFDPVKYWKKEESDYPEENTCDNEVFRSTILHHKKNKHIHASAADLLHYSIRIGNLDWCKFGHYKNEAGEIDFLCCRKVDTMLIASVKFQSAREISRHPAFMGICPTISHTC